MYSLFRNYSFLLFVAGYAFSHLARPVHVNGSDITEYLREYYTQKIGLNGAQAEHAVTTEIANNIKEKYGSLRETAGAVDSTVFELSTDPAFELPDGTTLTIGEERFNCAECLFDPSLIATMIPNLTEVYTNGFSQAVFDTINSCAEEIREEIMGAIILSGGNTLFSGISSRIKDDVCSWIKNDVDTFQSATAVNVIASDDRKHAAWQGGSALASMWSTFQHQKISRSEYDEKGASVVKQKCIR